MGDKGMANNGKIGIDPPITLIKGAGAVGAGIAAGTLGAPAVWGQGKKTIRFLNTETSIDSIRAEGGLRRIRAERMTGTQVIVDPAPLDDAFTKVTTSLRSVSRMTSQRSLSSVTSCCCRPRGI